MSQIIADILKLIADNQDVILSAVRLAATNKETTMATLKISDLSVGDWVYYDKGNTPYSIRSIYRTGIQDCVVLNDSVFPEGVICFVDRLKPIPITAEILEKNGFECIEEDADIALYGTPSCSIFHTKGTLRYRFDTPQASVVCWFVHELQHALRLAGVEEEINL